MYVRQLLLGYIHLNNVLFNVILCSRQKATLHSSSLSSILSTSALLPAQTSTSTPRHRYLAQSGYYKIDKLYSCFIKGRAKNPGTNLCAHGYGRKRAKEKRFTQLDCLLDVSQLVARCYIFSVVNVVFNGSSCCNIIYIFIAVNSNSLTLCKYVYASLITC